jgi:hypothetical protein
MKTSKVFYQIQDKENNEIRKFKTIVPVRGKILVENYFFDHYDMTNITILSIKDSIKPSYKHFCNIKVK